MDITAFVLVFPPTEEDEPFAVLPYFWIPEENIDIRVRRDHVPYDVWEKQGFLMTTEGNVVHYGFIEKFIEELGEKYNIREIAFDRWGAVQMVQNLEGMGFTVVPFGQGFKDMSPPTKELMKLTLEKKIASVFLETFLFYSGFFTPLYYLGNNKLANVAEIIKLIIRDESVHGTYIGYKFQLGFNELPEDEQEKLKEWMYDLLYTLYENEEGYTESLYDGVGWTEEVKTFLRYNANKALMNLGQDPLFPDTADDVNPIVMNGISTGTSNHDFFSQVGNGYLLGEVEAMQDEDYDYGL